MIKIYNKVKDLFIYLFFFYEVWYLKVWYNGLER